DQAVATTLAVQTALQQGREHLLHGEYKAAVATLEGELPFINGNQVYLKLLQDAYRAYIKELRLAKQEEEAQRYLRRLLILDRGAILDNPPGNLAAASPAAANGAKPSSVPEPTSTATVRELTPEQDPFHSSHALNNPDERTRNLLERAEQEFGSR